MRFSWPGDSHALYLERIVPGQSVFEEPPVTGFVAFHSEIGILIALQDLSDALVQACNHYSAEEFYGVSPGVEDPPRDVASWQRLANLVLHAAYDEDTQTWSGY